ncbi:hypothetical protein FTO70_15230 [Methanosarcina sp. KYL-1]|nr:hypothetical protein [Methanosarcina sp. KYL-1]
MKESLGTVPEKTCSWDLAHLQMNRMLETTYSYKNFSCLVAPENLFLICFSGTGSLTGRL